MKFLLLFILSAFPIAAVGQSQSLSTQPPADPQSPRTTEKLQPEADVPDVFRAVGAAVGVAVAIEGRVDRPPVTVKFTNRNTSDVLDYLCKNAGCTWEYDNGSRQLRVRFQAPCQVCRHNPRFRPEAPWLPPSLVFTFAAAGATVGGTAFAACCGPAVKASLLDPPSHCGANDHSPEAAKGLPFGCTAPNAQRDSNPTRSTICS